MALHLLQLKLIHPSSSSTQEVSSTQTSVVHLSITPLLLLDMVLIQQKESTISLETHGACNGV